MHLFRKITSIFYKPYVRWRISKTTLYKYNDLLLEIPPGVFHPKYFYSTQYLLKHIESLDLTGKSFLEPGCGSGLISLVAAQKGANVTAFDINPSVVSALSDNAKRNKLQIEILESNLFDNISNTRFDIVAINPPYYKKNPTSDSEKAWYHGENYEYYKKLFAQIPAYISSHSLVVIVLSEDCDLKTIQCIAQENKFVLNTIDKKKFSWEYQILFRLVMT